MTHSMVIHALMVSWYPSRRFGNPTSDVMMDLDPWRSPCVVEVVDEASCLMKKPWRSPWTHIWWLCPIKGDDVVIDDLMNTWNPWWRPWCPCKGHESHCLHLIWLDGMMKAPTRMWWHLDTCLHVMGWCGVDDVVDTLACSWRWPWYPWWGHGVLGGEHMTILHMVLCPWFLDEALVAWWNP